jgi:hypothetical protein
MKNFNQGTTLNDSGKYIGNFFWIEIRTLISSSQ